jgi:hypothetical protein
MKKDNQQTPGTLVGEDNKSLFSWLRTLPKLKIAGVVFVILLIGSLGWWGYAQLRMRSSHRQTTTCTDNTSGDVLPQAVAILQLPTKKSKTKNKQLKPIAAKIQTLPGYDKDPNCLYVVTEYYIGLGDSQNARTYFDKLSSVYDTKNGYDPSIKGLAATPETLKLRVEWLEKQSEIFKNNSFYGPKV